MYAQSFNEPLEFFDANDGKEFNACLMLLTQIGEQSGKISNELKEKYKEVSWKEIKNFRNRAVHDYTGLDRFITFDIIKQHVPMLKPVISTIIRNELSEGSFDKEEFNVAATSQYLNHVDFKSIKEGNY